MRVGSAPAQGITNMTATIATPAKIIGVERTFRFIGKQVLSAAVLHSFKLPESSLLRQQCVSDSAALPPKAVMLTAVRSLQRSCCAAVPVNAAGPGLLREPQLFAGCRRSTAACSSRGPSELAHCRLTFAQAAAAQGTQLARPQLTERGHWAPQRSPCSPD